MTVDRPEEAVDVRKKRQPWQRPTPEDVARWAELYQQRTSILKIAKSEGVDPGTVSSHLARSGVKIGQGRHFVPQPPVRVSEPLARLLERGPAEVIEVTKRAVWGVETSEIGKEQVTKFCRFIELHRAGKGVAEIATELAMHRSSVSSWREGADRPYLIKLAEVAMRGPLPPGWQLCPVSIDSGGNSLGSWTRVPIRVDRPQDIEVVVSTSPPTESAPLRGAGFGISKDVFGGMRAELFAYLLGFILGDSSKSGGQGVRFASMNLDLQLTAKEPSNARLGEFVCLCANSIGIRMKRGANKMPSGASRFGRHPSEAYRWYSERSPLLAWMFSVCLGLRWDQTTSTHPVSMEWIMRMPEKFRLRFVQALADSDASVKPSEVVITSVPNSDLVTRILKSLGASSAHTVTEGGIPLRSMVNRREASRLPLFNEMVRGYRYDLMMRPSARPSKYGSIESRD